MTRSISQKAIKSATGRLSLESIAKSMHVDQQRISDLLHGKSRLTDSECVALEQVTGRTVGQLALDAVVAAADPQLVKVQARQIAATDELLRQLTATDAFATEDEPSLRTRAAS